MCALGAYHKSTQGGGPSKNQASQLADAALPRHPLGRGDGRTGSGAGSRLGRGVTRLRHPSRTTSQGEWQGLRFIPARPIAFCRDDGRTHGAAGAPAGPDALRAATGVEGGTSWGSGRATVYPTGPIVLCRGDGRTYGGAGGPARPEGRHAPPFVKDLPRRGSGKVHGLYLRGPIAVCRGDGMTYRVAGAPAGPDALQAATVVKGGASRGGVGVPTVYTPRAHRRMPYRRHGVGACGPPVKGRRDQEAGATQKSETCTGMRQCAVVELCGPNSSAGGKLGPAARHQCKGCGPRRLEAGGDSNCFAATRRRTTRTQLVTSSGHWADSDVSIKSSAIRTRHRGWGRSSPSHVRSVAQRGSAMG